MGATPPEHLPRSTGRLVLYLPPVVSPRCSPPAALSRGCKPPHFGDGAETWPARCTGDQPLLEKTVCSQQAAVKCNVCLRNPSDKGVPMQAGDGAGAFAGSEPRGCLPCRSPGGYQGRANGGRELPALSRGRSPWAGCGRIRAPSLCSALTPSALLPPPLPQLVLQQDQPKRSRAAPALPSQPARLLPRPGQREQQGRVLSLR